MYYFLLVVLSLICWPNYSTFARVASSEKSELVSLPPRLNGPGGVVEADPVSSGYVRLVVYVDTQYQNPDAAYGVCMLGGESTGFAVNPTPGVSVLLLPCDVYMLLDYEAGNGGSVFLDMTVSGSYYLSENYQGYSFVRDWGHDELGRAVGTVGHSTVMFMRGFTWCFLICLSALSFRWVRRIIIDDGSVNEWRD